jgi:Mn-dependent DtxR family transcriptional regulator
MALKSTKNERIYLRISGTLKHKVEKYAKRRGTTLSALTIRFFNNLLEHEKQEQKAREIRAVEKFF